MGCRTITTGRTIAAGRTARSGGGIASGRAICVPIVQPDAVAGLAFWWKADAGTFEDTALTVPAADDNDEVAGWGDSSVNGKNLTQTGGTTVKPNLRTGANGKNGLPIVAFTSSDALADNLDFTSTAITTPAYVYTVYRKRTSSQTGTRGFLVSSTSSSTIGGSCNVGGSGANHKPVIRYTNTAEFAHSQALDNTWAIVRYRLDAVEVGIRINNGSEETLGSLTPAYSNWLQLCGGTASSSPDLDLAELAAYTGNAISASNDDGLMNYLNDRWAIY